jgi:hypothetical protein
MRGWAQSPAKKPAVRLKFIGSEFEAASTIKAAGSRVDGSAVVFAAQLLYATARLQRQRHRNDEGVKRRPVPQAKNVQLGWDRRPRRHESPLWTSYQAEARDPPHGVALVLS